MAGHNKRWLLGLAGIELILFIAWYGVIIWICDQNSVDDTPMF